MGVSAHPVTTREGKVSTIVYIEYKVCVQVCYRSGFTPALPGEEVRQRCAKDKGIRR